MRVSIAAATLCLLAGMPARAADLSTIGCVEETVNAKARTQLEADVKRNLAEPGKRPTYDPGVQNALNIASAACAKVNSWAMPAQEAAARYALAKIGLPFAQAALAEKGFDASELESDFAALAEDVRNRPLTPQEMQELIKGAVTDEAKQTRENASLLNQYFSMLNTVEYASYDFSQA